MIRKFIEGKRYSHPHAKTLDIKVMRVVYRGKRITRMIICYISKITGNYMYLPNSLDGLDRVTCQNKDLKNWTMVK